MAYRYITAKLVAVQPQYDNKPVPLEMWKLLALAGVAVGEDQLKLVRSEIASVRRGGNSWAKAKQSAQDAIAARFEEVRHSPYYNDPNNCFIVDIVYAREG